MNNGKVGQELSSVKFSFVKRSRQKLAASSFDVADAVDDNATVKELPATVLKNRKFEEVLEIKEELVIPVLSNACFFTSAVKPDTADENTLLNVGVKRNTDDTEESPLENVVLKSVKIGDDPNYDSVPVEEYGKALLRGMGWKEGEPIGVTNKKVTKMVESIPRPKGLGLGAELPTPVRGKSKSKHLSKEEEELVLRVGAYIRRTVSDHRNEYGVVVSIDEDNARVLVRMAISKTTVSLSQHAICVVSSREYKEKAKCLNQNKYERNHGS